VLIFPYWCALLTLTIPAVGLVWMSLTARRRDLRNREGRCVACGYDLRATPDRCPECGATPATVAG
jgi:hypothetical protein